MSDGSLCATCLKDPPRHAGIHAATLYTAGSRRLVLTYKHGRRLSLARMMARLMAARLPSDLEQALLVPVPLHRWRLWKRGFNQAALLAKELGIITGQELALDALRRTKATPSLGGLGKADRAKAVQGAIQMNAKRADLIRGKDIILVDDVLTSGATSDACVKRLIGAGARHVHISCFARVLDGDVLGRSKNETPGITKIPGAA